MNVPYSASIKVDSYSAIARCAFWILINYFEKHGGLFETRDTVSNFCPAKPFALERIFKVFK